MRFVSDYISSSSVSIITTMFRPAFIRRTSGRSLGTIKQSSAVLNIGDYWAKTSLNLVSKKPGIHVSSLVHKYLVLASQSHTYSAVRTPNSQSLYRQQMAVYCHSLTKQTHSAANSRVSRIKRAIFIVGTVPDRCLCCSLSS